MPMIKKLMKLHQNVICQDSRTKWAMYFLVLIIILNPLSIPIIYAHDEANNHLVLRLYPEKNVFKIGDPIDIYLVLINKGAFFSDDSIEIYLWEKIPPKEMCFSTHNPNILLNLVVLNDKNKEVPMDSGARANPGKISLERLKSIAPSFIWGMKINLIDNMFRHYDITKPGKYSIKAIYENRTREWVEESIKNGGIKKEDLPVPIEQYFGGVLESNTISIEVK